MNIVNIDYAKTNLSQLIDQAVRGEPFIIAKAGKPMVRVEAIQASTDKMRVGFMVGEIMVPADCDVMGSPRVAELFE